jgi:hypothetical protein
MAHVSDGKEDENGGRDLDHLILHRREHRESMHFVNFLDIRTSDLSNTRECEE